jgi:hypothetical protein
MEVPDSGDTNKNADRKIFARHQEFSFLVDRNIAIASVKHAG